MSRRLSCAIAALVLCTAAHVQAGSFALVDDPNENLENLILHPKGYVGSATNPTPALTVRVCLNATNATIPGGTAAALSKAEASLERAVATFNRRKVDTQNLATGAASDLGTTEFDFESVVLQQLGACLGLGRPNVGAESAVASNLRDATRSKRGSNDGFDIAAGADGIIGSHDDVRGDDVNLYWFEIGTNNPLGLPAIIDTTTFRRIGALPSGHSFAANADRDVLAALSPAVPSTESLMQQGFAPDEVRRRLTAEDIATLRLGQAGRDGLQGTADDYTVQLSYVGRNIAPSNCDIPVEFTDTDVQFAQCNITEVDNLTTGHKSVGSARILLTNAFASPSTSWYLGAANPNTTLTLSSSPNPSITGAPITLTATVVKVSGINITGNPSGTVEVTASNGQSCTLTLNAANPSTGSCQITPTSAGTLTLNALYRGFQGFDASVNAVPLSHVVQAPPVPDAVRNLVHLTQTLQTGCSHLAWNPPASGGVSHYEIARNGNAPAAVTQMTEHYTTMPDGLPIPLPPGWGDHWGNGTYVVKACNLGGCGVGQSLIVNSGISCGHMGS